MWVYPSPLCITASQHITFPSLVWLITWNRCMQSSHCGDMIFHTHKHTIRVILTSLHILRVKTFTCTKQRHSHRRVLQDGREEQTKLSQFCISPAMGGHFYEPRNSISLSQICYAPKAQALFVTVKLLELASHFSPWGISKRIIKIISVGICIGLYRQLLA